MQTIDEVRASNTVNSSNAGKPSIVDKLLNALKRKSKTSESRPRSRPNVILGKVPENATIVDSYFVHPHFAKVTIATLPELGGGKAYFIEEVELSDEERAILTRLMDILSVEVSPPEDEAVDPAAYIEREAGRLAKKYGLHKRISRLGEGSWDRILYYLRRDLIGYGPLHVIMSDRLIEDISVNGVGLPVYVWHVKYESMPTNLVILDPNTLDGLLIKLTHLAQKHISTAFPLLDAMLPTKDRLAATFRFEVSPRGSTFTIRRFRAEPFSIVDLIELGTMDEFLAAYFWIMIENRMTMAVIGGTGAGKTSTLNALASLVKPSMKIVTVEEIPELQLPHDNWVQLMSRASYGLGASKVGEVSLFDLVKVSLRYRPDYIIVGEVRGEEAFVLFQAIATGHGGLTTLHAEDIEQAVKRLTSPPMNVAESYIPLINVAIFQERVQLPFSRNGASFGRRIRGVYEVLDFGWYEMIASWNPIADTYTHDFKRSEMLRRVALRHGVSAESVYEELRRRAAFLRDLSARGIRRNADVRVEVMKYYLSNAIRPIAVQTQRMG